MKHKKLIANIIICMWGLSFILATNLKSLVFYFISFILIVAWTSIVRPRFGKNNLLFGLNKER